MAKLQLPADTAFLLHTLSENIIEYLQDRQQADGEFPTLRRFPNSEVPVYVKPTQYAQWYFFGACPFATANVAYHLRYVRDPRIEQVRSRACQSLAAGMENGVARYVPDHHKPFDFPADIDDTCLAVAAMRANGLDASYNQDLVLDNMDQQGDFLTWFIPRASQASHPPNMEWLVNDARICRERMRGYGVPESMLAAIEREYESASEPAIAANVLLCTGITARTAPALDRLIQRLDGGDVPLQYYADPLVPWFHAARLYDAGITRLAPLRDRALQYVGTRMGPDGNLDTPFNAVAAALTLLFFKAFDAAALPTLLAHLTAYAARCSRAGWEPLHYCNDLHGVFVDGGAELTAALYLDAFQRCLLASAPTGRS